MRTDLTKSQKDYAIFLPAISSFYSTYIGKQRFEEYIPKHRIPSHLTNGIESLNYLNKNEGIFQYKWSLYSPGHAELDMSKHVPKEDMIRNRDRKNTFLVADSGGYQAAKGVWQANWKDPNCPYARKKRTEVLSWMDAYMDYGMTLDMPVWVINSEKGRNATGVHTYQDAVIATQINNDYWINNRNGECKFLNILQGETHSQSDKWYASMKDYCDPKVYPDAHFNGWALGGQNTCDMHMAIRRIVTIIRDGLLEPGVHDYLHFLGTSRLEWALMFTDIQRAIRKYHNPNFTITFDCASPFLATANGQVYTNTETEDRKKWLYRMKASADDRRYHNDNRSYRDAVLQDGIFSCFEDSPISKGLKISDICYYAPGQKNKINKVGKTSWDSFSYELLMAHNIWMHINAVQKANREYDKGKYPRMLVEEKHNQLFFRDIVEEIFSNTDKNRSLEIIDEYSRFWMSVPGTGGITGKRTINSNTMFYELFEEIESNDDDVKEFSESEIANLTQLEKS